jgi:hypothetical protein
MEEPKLKFLLSIALALGISAVAYGAAASLPVAGGAAQSGSASATCDSDGVIVSYTLTGTDVTTITVTDINDAAGVEAGSCAGADLNMNVTGGANADGFDCDVFELGSTTDAVTKTATGTPVADLASVALSIISGAATGADTCTEADNGSN